MENEKIGVFAGILKAQAYLSGVGVAKELDVSTGGGSYKARGIDGIMNAVSSALVAGGIFPICNYKTKSRETVTVVTKFGEKQAEKVVVEGTFYFMAGDGSKSPECTYEASAINNSDKGSQIAMSYCLKYFFAQCLAIPFSGLQEEGELENPEIVKKEKPHYKDEDIEKNHVSWKKAFFAKTMNAEKLIARIESQFTLTNAQKNIILTLEEVANDGQ